ncbi:MAG TPA: SPFH domain-containing protein [Ktedonobacteraceae bacterium]
MGLFEWGIRQIDKAEGTIQEFGKRFGFLPLSWGQVARNDKSRDGVMWRIPDPRVPQASMLSRVQAIIVTEQEQVVVLRNGMLGEQLILPPGLYDIQRLEALRGSIDVIWFATKEVQLQWGVADIVTSDGVSVGANGYYRTSIIDPIQFLKVVAGNEQVYTEVQLRDYAKQAVSNAIRNQIARTSVMDFQQAQPEFERACYEKLASDFARWGLEFRGMTIVGQVIPEDVRTAMASAGFKKRAEIKIAEQDIELEQLKAQQEQVKLLLEAQRIQLLGNAQVNVMRNQISSGLDPLEIQRIDAIKIFAEHPAEGALTDNRPQIVSQLMPQPPAPPQVNPTIVTGVPFLAPPPQPSNIVVSSAPASASNGPASREKIQEDLDKLDERFINGEMSEQTYLMLKEKFQKKLDQLS